MDKSIGLMCDKAAKSYGKDAVEWVRQNRPWVQ